MPKSERRTASKILITKFQTMPKVGEKVLLGLVSHLSLEPEHQVPEHQVPVTSST